MFKVFKQQHPHPDPHQRFRSVDAHGNYRDDYTLIPVGFADSMAQAKALTSAPVLEAGWSRVQGGWLGPVRVVH